MYQNYRSIHLKQESAGKKYKLIYFGFRGRAEGIRLTFAAGGVEYEDCRIQPEEWAKLKPNTPFGGLPVLVIDGKMLGQSVAIGRTAARITGLVGIDEFDDEEADALVESLSDLRSEIFDVMSAKEDKEEKVATLLSEKCKPKFVLLQSWLGSNEYLVANKLTWADIWFYHVIEILVLTLQQPQVLDGYPELKALYERVGQNPGIAKHLKCRPASDL